MKTMKGTELLLKLPSHVISQTFSQSPGHFRIYPNTYTNNFEIAIDTDIGPCTPLMNSIKFSPINRFITEAFTWQGGGYIINVAFQ